MVQGQVEIRRLAQLVDIHKCEVYDGCVNDMYSKVRLQFIAMNFCKIKFSYSNVNVSVK